MKYEYNKIAEMLHDKFQQYWLSLAKKDAETDKYTKELLEMTINIIDKKDYSHLFGLLRAYDKVMKTLQELKYGIKYESKNEVPFWSYCMGKKEETAN